MPLELVGLISPEHYHTLMGLAGIASASIVLFIWGQAL